MLAHLPGWMVVICVFLSGILTEPSTGQAETGNIFVSVSVDWEGRDIDPENIRAIKEFRSRFSGLPLIHFLNAAYFTRNNQDGFAREKILSVIRPQDETGLHIHSWKSLVEASGVTYRHFPKWTPGIYHESQVRSCTYSDCGHEVPLWAYRQEEIRKIVRFSKHTLIQQGLGVPVSFRAGGWMSNRDVLKVIAEEGFRFDSSAVPVSLFGTQLDGYSIPEWVDRLWPGVTSVSQPWIVSTGQNRMIEMPDNGCLADYMSEEAMYEVFRQNLDVWRRNPGQNVYIHFGFHQETAQYYLHRLEGALERIIYQAKSDEIPLYFTTFDRIEI